QNSSAKASAGRLCRRRRQSRLCLAIPICPRWETALRITPVRRGADQQTDHHNRVRRTRRGGGLQLRGLASGPLRPLGGRSPVRWLLSVLLLAVVLFGALECSIFGRATPGEGGGEGPGQPARHGARLLRAAALSSGAFPTAGADSPRPFSLPGHE